MVIAATTFLFSLLAGSVNAGLLNSFKSPLQNRAQNTWSIQKFRSLVAFGDSYTDEDRLNYFASHNFNPPPVGWREPPSNQTASGGKTWPRFVAESTGAHLYDYAVSGAVCSNNITPRIFEDNFLFPAVQQYEVPAYIADSKYYKHGKKFMHIPPDQTVYSMWIGTNDVGVNAFLTDSQVPGKTVSDYMDCVYNALDRIYANGARYFVLMNLAPLQLTPLYATIADGGFRRGEYWPDKPKNTTEIAGRMLETVSALNDVYKYRTPYEVLIAKRYPGAHFASFDVNSLITDIHQNPEKYLASPANATGYQHHCKNFAAGTNCHDLPHPNSFLWYDPLHPSQRTDQIIAAAFVDVVQGNSKYAAYYSC